MNCVVCGRSLDGIDSVLEVTIGPDVLRACGGDCLPPDPALGEAGHMAAEAAALGDRLLEARHRGDVRALDAVPLALKAHDRVAALVGLDQP